MNDFPNKPYCNPTAYRSLHYQETLKQQLGDIESIITAQSITVKTDNGPAVRLSGYELLEAKIECIKEILNPAQ